MQKKFGKLTPAQFRAFVDQLPNFQAMAKDFRKDCQGTPEGKWNEILKEDYGWSWMYECPLTVHLAIVMYTFNLTQWHKDGIVRRERLAMNSRNWAAGNPGRWWIATQSMGQSI